MRDYVIAKRRTTIQHPNYSSKVVEKGKKIKVWSFEQCGWLWLEIDGDHSWGISGEQRENDWNVYWNWCKEK